MGRRPPTLPRGTPLILALALLTGFAACSGGDDDGSDPVGPGETGPTLGTVSKVSGDNQSDTVNATLPEPLVVEVTDTDGNAMSDLSLDFRASDGGTVSDATTDSNGRASVEWTLGETAGTQTVQVYAPNRDSPSATFSVDALPGAAVDFAARTGNDQIGRTRQPLPEPLVLEVSDAYGNGVPDVEVAFSILAGGGEISPMRAATGDDGRIQASWQLGGRTIDQSAQAEAGDLGTVALSARVDTTRLVQLRVRDPDSPEQTLESVARGDTVIVDLDLNIEALFPESRGAIAAHTTWQPLNALNPEFLLAAEGEEVSAISWDLSGSEDPRIILAFVVARTTNDTPVEIPANLLFTVPADAPRGEIVLNLELVELVAAETFEDLTDEVSVVSTTLTIR